MQSIPKPVLDAAKLHNDALIMDMTCPLFNDPQYWHWWIEGGATVATPTVALNHNTSEAIKNISNWLTWIRDNDDKFRHVTSIEDIYRAKDDDKLGIVFHFQNTLPLERDLGMVEVFARLGLMIMQLTYNTKNHVGTGCEEASDDGLSKFGRRVVREMNRCGIVVDGSHTGKRTVMDAIEVSEKPVVISHGNCKSVCDNQRNLDDETILAIAEQGGLVGLVGFPTFVRRGTDQPTLDQLVDHVDHVCQLVGHSGATGIAIDYYNGTFGADSVEATQRWYEAAVKNEVWNPNNYEAPPHHFPQGIEDPRGYPNLTAKLIERGYSEEDVRRIWGQNWIRIFEAYGR